MFGPGRRRYTLDAGLLKKELERQDRRLNTAYRALMGLDLK
jgi:uncharacterized protein YecT (DUF1311 family)